MMKRLFQSVLLFCAGAPLLAATPFTQERLVAALTRDLAAHYRPDGQLQIELVEPWSPPADAPADATLVVTEYPVQVSTTMGLRCRLVSASAGPDQGSAADEFNLLVRAAVWLDAWAARQPLATGAPLDPSALEVRRIDSLRVRDALPASVAVRSYVSSRQVPADCVLAWHDIAPLPLVRKGETIDVVAQDGMLTVTLKALALQSGAQGDLVVARNPETLKEISGRVVGNDCIAVAF